MGIRDCLEKGLLKKSETSKDKIDSSLLISSDFLEKAKGNMKMRYYNIAFTLAYSSMFHAARALLFSKGYTERSHMCLVLFLKEEYKSSPEIHNLLEVLDAYRVSRHSVQYEGEYVSEVDAKEAIKDAGYFLDVATKELKK